MGINAGHFRDYVNLAGWKQRCLAVGGCFGQGSKEMMPWKQRQHQGDQDEQKWMEKMNRRNEPSLVDRDDCLGN